MREEIPKTTWGEGPWQDEPDRLEFEHKGFPCLLNRNRSGVWCGYVGVPPSHPWHGRDYSDVPVEVHGGLTYASECQGKICHVAKPGEPEDVYWLGFDCAHAYDFMPAHEAIMKTIPGMPPRMYESGAKYRTIDYAQAETERLAEQARAAA